VEPEFPRPLEQRERALIEHLLQDDFPGRDALLAQIPFVRVVSRDHTVCLSFSIDDHVPASDATGGPLVAGSKDYDRLPITVELWIVDGYLRSLEVSWTSDDPPTGLPDPSELLLPGQLPGQVE
jgi:hypothetical protein